MFNTAKVIKFYVGDFHMGEGAESPHEDFKHHTPGVSMYDTKKDCVLDKYFGDFVDWTIPNLGHCPEVQLVLNGDTFDFSSVSLPGESLAFPHEKEAVAKLQIIMAAHPVFFDALRRFCTALNTILKFMKGNHDWELNWPQVQQAIVERVCPDNPGKILFLYDEFDRGTYCRHGENEPHIKSNPDKPIIRAAEIIKLPAAIIKPGAIVRDILDVPLGYYLNAELMHNLKPHNYLLGRMYTHGFVWLDGVKNIGRRSWYRSRWFAFLAAYYFLKTLIDFIISPRSWHVKMKAGLKEILQVLWWTATGVLTGTTPRDSALRVLYKRENVDCVIYAHEHECAFEVLQINNRTKTYMNIGTWMPQMRDKALARLAPWKRFCWLQRALKFFRDIFVARELELVWKCSVGVENINEDGEASRRLTEWDRIEKTLKQM